MNWFMHHPVLLALVCAGVAVGYGVWLIFWLLKQPEGNERMKEISGAVREYCEDVRSSTFPSDAESYHTPQSGKNRKTISITG